jgi:ribonuclease VapC
MSILPSSYIILDASALITVLADEIGQEVVIPLLPKAIMSSVNVAEVAKFLIESKGVTKTDTVSIITNLIERIIPFDQELAFLSADITNKTRSLGLSLGDRACIALGMLTASPIYTADKAWKHLQLENLNVQLIR